MSPARTAGTSGERRSLAEVVDTAGGETASGAFRRWAQIPNAAEPTRHRARATRAAFAPVSQSNIRSASTTVRAAQPRRLAQVHRSGQEEDCRNVAAAGP